MERLLRGLVDRPIGVGLALVGFALVILIERFAAHEA